MSSNRLSLLVNFVAADKLSGALRNIIGLGRNGSKSIKELTGESRKLENQLKAVRREIGSASGNVSQLVNRERELERQIAETNRAIERRARLDAIEGDRRAMLARGEDLRQRGQENIAQGATLAAPLILAVAQAGQFSSGMVDIQQKAALTNRETQALSANILRMADAAKMMPEDMRSGLDLLLARGMELDVATAAIGPAARLATAYRVEVPDAAAAAFASINNLKVASADTARVFDVMAAAGNEGGFEVRDMARHFPTLTAQMQALGQTGVPAVADLSAALQVAMNTAGNADEAGNNIVNLLGKINSPGTIRAFEKNFGVDLPAAMRRLEQQGYSALEAIALVTQQATGGDERQLAFAFEDRHAQLGVMALIQNMEEYRRVRAAAMNSAGTVDRAFDQRAANDFMLKWTAFKSTASQLAIIIGNGLLPAASEALEMIAGVARAVGNWAQANPEAAATIAKLVAGLAMFKIGLGAAQFALGGLMGPLSTGISLWRRYRELGSLAAVFPRIAAGVRVLGLALRFLMFNGIGLFVTVLAGAAYLIYTHWDTISATFQRNYTRIRNITLGLVVIFAPVIARIMLLAKTVYDNWDRIKSATIVMVSYMERIAGPFLAPIMMIVRYFQGLKNRFYSMGADIVRGLINGVLSMAGSAVSTFLNLAESVGGGFARQLDIHSPSRVFMAYGRYTAEGLRMGINQGAGRPVAAMTRLARGVAAAGAIGMVGGMGGMAPAGAATPARAPMAVTINVYQQPGQDGAQLAREIRRELQRLDGVAQRSSYQED